MQEGRRTLSIVPAVRVGWTLWGRAKRDVTALVAQRQPLIDTDAKASQSARFFAHAYERALVNDSATDDCPRCLCLILSSMSGVCALCGQMYHRECWDQMTGNHAAGHVGCGTRRNGI